MKITYKDNKLELGTTIATMLTSVFVIATFVLLHGFEKELLPARFLHIVQITAFMIFIAEKAVRFTNAQSKRQFLRANWFEIPLLVLLAIAVVSASKYSAHINATRIFALSIYLIVQVVAKACKGMVA